MSLREIVDGGLSLIAGMKVTFRRLFQPLVTVQYPRYRIEMSPAYRGHIELRVFDDTGTHKCIACGTCERMCPSGVIEVRGEKGQAKGPKIAVHYVIDFSKCSLCGLCIESCPTEALKYSKEYETVGESRLDCVIDVLARLETKAEEAKKAEPLAA